MFSFPDEKYECNLCKKTYKNLNTLSVHQAIDCGKAKTFQCPVCDFKCKRKFNLKIHVAKKHLSKSEDIFLVAWNLQDINKS